MNLRFDLFNLRRLRAALLLVLAFMGLPLAYAELRDPATNFFHSGFGDLKEEAQTAKADGQVGVLLMFESDDCPFCTRMKNEVLNRTEVQDWYRERFRILMINVDGDLDITDFEGNTVAEKDFAFKHNRVRATPVFVFFNTDGERLARYTGATSGIDEFMLLGRYVADGHHQEGSFTKFKRAQREAAKP
jgi:thioredoxin-related protein